LNGGECNWNCNCRTEKWATVRTQAGIPGSRFYDLRHTGITLAANTGAGLADLMAHLGHASVRAAMIYQHATAEQQCKISTGISAAVVEIRLKQQARSDGSVAPVPGRRQVKGQGTVTVRSASDSRGAPNPGAPARLAVALNHRGPG
jgi:hypothetical protein